MNDERPYFSERWFNRQPESTGVKAVRFAKCSYLEVQSPVLAGMQTSYSEKIERSLVTEISIVSYDWLRLAILTAAIVISSLVAIRL